VTLSKAGGAISVRVTMAEDNFIVHPIGPWISLFGVAVVGFGMRWRRPESWMAELHPSLIVME
jgi:hypothetical protein